MHPDALSRVHELHSTSELVLAKLRKGSKLPAKLFGDIPPAINPQVTRSAQIPADSLFQSLASNPRKSRRRDEVSPIPLASECAAHLALLQCFVTIRATLTASKQLDAAFDCEERPVTVQRNEGPKQLKDPTYASRQVRKWYEYVDFAAVRFLVWWKEVRYYLERTPDGRYWVPDDKIPPVDVIMVWHSFLLNPKMFKDKSEELGWTELYNVEFPWPEIKTRLSTDKFILSMSVPQKAFFAQITNGLAPYLTDYFAALASRRGADCRDIRAYSKCDHTLRRPFKRYGDGDAAFIEHCLAVAQHPILCPLRASLVLAVERQSNFVVKMERQLWIRSPAAAGTLSRARDRYTNFLALSRLRRDLVIVPTLDIDLVWHTHQLSAARYRADTEALAGRFLNHDDSLPDAALSDGREATREAWRVRFGTEYDGVCMCWECEAMLDELGRAAEGGGEAQPAEMAKRVAEKVTFHKAVEVARRKGR